MTFDLKDTCVIIHLCKLEYCRGGHGLDRMVVGFTTTCL